GKIEGGVKGVIKAEGRSFMRDVKTLVGKGMKLGNRVEALVDVGSGTDLDKGPAGTIEVELHEGQILKSDTGDDEGVIYRRTDKTGKEKDYVGQAKNKERYKERQKEHQRANKDADYEFTEIDRGTPGKDLDMKEQKHIDAGGGPTNKSNPNGGLSNKKNVIKKQ